jgi:fatty acid desaturase
VETAIHVVVDGKPLTREEAENRFHMELKAIVKKLELMKENRLVFWISFAITVVPLPFIYVGAWRYANDWRNVLIFSTFLVFVSAWLGTLGHDVAHVQVYRTRKTFRTALRIFLGNICLGFDNEWWDDKHNRHHQYTHINGKDPDVILPLAMSAEQARERELTSESFLVKHAKLTFPPLLPLQAFFARISSVKFLRKDDAPLSEKAVRWVGIGIYAALYAALLAKIAANTDVLHAAVFFAVHQAGHGIYNSLMFATNHKRWQAVDRDSELTWVGRNVYFSHNIASGTGIKEVFYTWMQGGLNYQIEHHLFQTMPRCNLRKLRPHVIEQAAKYNFPYSESGIFPSWREVFFTRWSITAKELAESPMGA